MASRRRHHSIDSAAGRKAARAVARRGRVAIATRKPKLGTKAAMIVAMAGRGLSSAGVGSAVGVGSAYVRKVWQRYGVQQ